MILDPVKLTIVRTIIEYNDIIQTVTENEWQNLITISHKIIFQNRSVPKVLEKEDRPNLY